MRHCDWCEEEYDNESAPANEYDPYCSSLCAVQAEEDSMEDDYDADPEDDE